MPRSSWLMFERLRVNSPASTSSTIENAICAVVSTARKRAEPRPLTARVPCAFMTWPGFAPLTRHAGTRPNTSTVTSDAPAANNSAAGFNAVSPSARLDGSMPEISRTISAATSKLASPPIAISTNDSASSCRTSTPRLAPIDARIAISPVARRAAREQQIRDVHADDQQHEHRHADQQLERPLRACAQRSPPELAGRERDLALHETAS